MTRKTARYFPEAGGQEEPERETSGLSGTFSPSLEKNRDWWCDFAEYYCVYWHTDTGHKVH